MKRILAKCVMLALLLCPASLVQAQEVGDEWVEPITGMEFVWVPGGCYEMGCGEWAGDDCREDEFPVHEVCVDGFWMGKYEVTIEQWQAMMGDYPTEFLRGGLYPVTNVSWDDIQQFIFRMNFMSGTSLHYRLPREAEWEYACRSGGQEEIYSGGSEFYDFAWTEENTRGTQPVGTKLPNGLGIFDMSGNAWELQQDCYMASAYSNYGSDNPLVENCGQGDITYVTRGGSCGGGYRAVTCMTRLNAPPSLRYDFISFRLVRN